MQETITKYQSKFDGLMRSIEKKIDKVLNKAYDEVFYQKPD